MIKNVKLKRLIVNLVSPVLSLANKFFSKEPNTIFFYCANDLLNDNSRAIFDYLIENKLNEKYKIVCGLNNPSIYEDLVHKNVSFVSKSKCVIQYMTSGVVFYCMGKLPIKPTKNQMVINMWHGVPLKKIGLLSNVSNGKEFFFSYVCAPSETWRPIMASAFGCPLENVIICGEPKADKLLIPKKDRKEKIIVWTPTFRQSDYLGYCDSKQPNLLPLFERRDWDELNDYLLKREIKMFVKLHPMQNLYGLDSFKLSNLYIFSAKAFEKECGDVFELLSQSDALISDYSGIALDYLVLDRPICYVVDDYDDYEKTRGFVFNDVFEYMPGTKAYIRDDIYNFIEQVSNNIDLYKNERMLVNSKVNKYTDGKNCERILRIAGIIGA